jgi:hypothetical protein
VDATAGAAGLDRAFIGKERHLVSGIGKEFMEGTKYHNMGKSAHRLGMSQPPVEAEWDRTKAPIPLPPPVSLRLGDFSLRQAIEQRRSLREYSGQPLSLDELSYLLWCTQGVQIGRAHV